MSNAFMNPAEIGRIQIAVCSRFGLGERAMTSADRRHGVSHPRMLAMYLCRERLGLSYNDIALAFGGRDHTTVMHACRRIAAMLQAGNPQLQEAIAGIVAQLDSEVRLALPKAANAPIPLRPKLAEQKLALAGEPRAWTADAADLRIADVAPAISALRIKFLCSPIAEEGLGPQGEQQFLMALTMLEAAERHAKLAALERGR